MNHPSNIKNGFRAPPLEGWDAEIWSILNTVLDPEIPVLSVVDLGIVRNVSNEDNVANITITPTYTGCPATEVIAASIRLALIENGITNFKILTSITPPWTTDWISNKGREQLKKYGIAPPKGRAGNIVTEGVECPQCKSINTIIISEFGSTPCKSLFKCNDCKEPFDYFKCH